jgi:DNA-binding MarR family transcriptional regulator
MLAQELHYLLLIGYQYSSRAIIKQTNARQLMPGQPKILEFLLEHNGCTQREIGEGCALDKSTVTSLLYRMEDLGLVRKEACEQDRRVSHIFLTPTGNTLAGEVKEICSSVDQQAWAGIAEGEKQAFMNTFQKIVENLKRQGADE